MKTNGFLIDTFVGFHEAHVKNNQIYYHFKIWIFNDLKSGNLSNKRNSILFIDLLSFSFNKLGGSLFR